MEITPLSNNLRLFLPSWLALFPSNCFQIVPLSKKLCSYPISTLHAVQLAFTAKANEIACVASVSVGLPQVWSVFRFLNARKLGRAQKVRSPQFLLCQKAKSASRKNLRKNLLRRLRTRRSTRLHHCNSGRMPCWDVYSPGFPIPSVQIAVRVGIQGPRVCYRNS